MTQPRQKPYTAVYVMLISGDEVAMIRRYNTGYQDGNYTLPSGHIDEDESAKTAAIREVKEEVDVEIASADLELVHVIHRRSPDRIYIDFYFAVTKWTGEPTNAEPEKSDDLSWFELGNLPENTIPDVMQALENYNTNEYYSEIGWDAILVV